MTQEIVATRLKQLSTIKILRGKHDTIDGGGACLVEVAGWLYGDLDDHAACVCPVIAAFCRQFNDSISGDARRTKLLRNLVPLIGNTLASHEVELTRAYLATDWTVRENTPAFLDIVPTLVEHARALRALPRIIDEASVRAARLLLVHAKADAAYAADAAAANAAAYAARNAAAYAATAAAYAATRTAAHAAHAATAAAANAAAAIAARTAADTAAAAYAAARTAADTAAAAYAADAVRAAAYATANTAYATANTAAASGPQRKKIRALIAQRQASAVQLIRAMCAITESTL